MAKPLAHYAARSGNNRDKAIAQAYDCGGYGMKEIGEHFGLHYSRVSRIVSGQRKAKGKTPRPGMIESPCIARRFPRFDIDICRKEGISYNQIR